MRKNTQNLIEYKAFLLFFEYFVIYAGIQPHELQSSPLQRTGLISNECHNEVH